MGWKSYDVVLFDLGSLLLGLMKIAKLKSVYSSLIIAPRALVCDTDYGKSWAGSLLMWSDLTLGPSFKVK